MSRDIDRRDLLKGAGAATLAGLAGCIGSPGGGSGSSGPDVINVIGYPESGVQLFRDYYKATDGEHDIIVPDGLQDADLPKNVGNDMKNVTGTAPAAAGPNREAFTQMYEDEYGSSPGVFTSHSYDAVAILMLANAAAGANDGKKIRDQMRRVANPDGQKYGPEKFVDAMKAAARGENINYQGASSVVDFDENGDPASAAYDVWEYDTSKDGNVKTMDTIEFSGDPGGSMASESPGGTNRTVKVGILLPETGDLGSVGTPMIRAAQLPVKQVEESNLNLSVDSQVEDTRTAKQASMSGADALISAGYPAICGPASSGNNVPVSKEKYVKQGIVGCSPSSTALTVTNLKDDDYIFRTAPSDILQGQVMAQVTAERLEASKASTLFVNNSYGQQLSDKFSKSFTDEHDGEVLKKVSFNKGNSSYTSVVKEATGSE